MSLSTILSQLIFTKLRFMSTTFPAASTFHSPSPSVAAYAPQAVHVVHETCQADTILTGGNCMRAGPIYEEEWNQNNNTTEVYEYTPSWVRPESYAATTGSYAVSAENGETDALPLNGTTVTEYSQGPEPVETIVSALLRPDAEMKVTPMVTLTQPVSNSSEEEVSESEDEDEKNTITAAGFKLTRADGTVGTSLTIWLSCGLVGAILFGGAA